MPPAGRRRRPAPATGVPVPLAPDPADLALARAFVLDLAERLGERPGERLQTALLVGSRARGDALPGSDWDVLILVDAYDSDVRAAVGDAAWLREPDFIDVRGFTPQRWVWSVRVRAPLLRHALEAGVRLWPPANPTTSSPPT